MIAFTPSLEVDWGGLFSCFTSNLSGFTTIVVSGVGFVVALVLFRTIVRILSGK